MEYLNIRSRYTLPTFGVLAAACLLACARPSDGGSSPPSRDLRSVSQRLSTTTVLHSFAGGVDGARPELTAPVVSGATLYGTVTNSSHASTLFGVDTDGSNYGVLHTFIGTQRGYIDGTLLVSGSTLYGATYNDNDYGTVFKVDTDGSSYAVLHSFDPNIDGGFPSGSLFAIGSTLYGTTQVGPPGFNAGILFKIDMDGTGYQILRSFAGTGVATPNGSLALVGSTFYGTSIAGSPNTGTIFKVITKYRSRGPNPARRPSRRVAFRLHERGSRLA